MAGRSKGNRGGIFPCTIKKLPSPAGDAWKKPQAHFPLLPQAKTSRAGRNKEKKNNHARLSGHCRAPREIQGEEHFFTAASGHNRLFRIPVPAGEPAINRTAGKIISCACSDGARVRNSSHPRAIKKSTVILVVLPMPGPVERMSALNGYSFQCLRLRRQELVHPLFAQLIGHRIRSHKPTACGVRLEAIFGIIFLMPQDKNRQ